MNRIVSGLLDYVNDAKSQVYQLVVADYFQDGVRVVPDVSDPDLFVVDGIRYRLDVTVTPLPRNDEPEWMPATWRYVLTGDRVRLGESEAEVTASNVGDWHVDVSDYWHPKPWEHTEVKVKLAHTGDVWLPWPPDSPVEIFMDDARRAAYVLQQAFQGTREVE